MLYTAFIILDPIEVNQRIAGRVRELRAARGQSLEALARKSGVSRSMISLVERGASSVTAVVLEKLATGLGVMLASLFDVGSGEARAPDSPLSRRRDQAEWRDPESGYVRRNVSPRRDAAGADRRGSFSARWKGGLRVWRARHARAPAGVGARRQHRHRSRPLPIAHSDCLAIELDRPIMFHNPTRKHARYAVMIAAESQPRR